MNKPSVYLETTIPSYLTARPSGHLITAAKQQMTLDWWMNQRSKYDLFISAAVEDEAKRGDTEYVKARLKQLTGIPALDITPAVLALAKPWRER